MIAAFTDFAFKRNYKTRLTKQADLGYFTDDLKKEMPKWMWTKFQTWMFGQTMALIDGKPVAYEWDIDRFLAGLPAID